MSAYDTIVAGLSAAGLALTCLVGIHGTSDYHRNPAELEALLLDQSVDALQSAGLDWVRVRMEGQTAYLSGAAPSPEAESQAIEVVRTAAGEGGFWYGGIIAVEANFARLRTSEIVAPYTWRATKTSAGKLILLGQVPDNEVKSRLAAKAAPLAQFELQDRSEIDPRPLIATWAETAELGLAHLDRLDSGELRLSGLDVRLSGVALSDTDRIAASAAIASVAPPWRGTANIDGPSHWQAKHLEGTLVLSGACESPQTCAQIVAIAEQHFDGDVVNQMRIETSEYESWIEGVQKGLPHFSGFKSGRMFLATEGDEVTFTGQASASVLQFLQEDMADWEAGTAVTYAVERVNVTLAELTDMPPDTQPIIACQRALDHILQTHEIEFSQTSAKISRNSGAALDKILSVSGGCAETLKIEIIGQADPSAAGSRDPRLGLARAEAVANYLISAGFDKARLIVSGVGSERITARNQAMGGWSASQLIAFSVQEWSD